jgi:hypothetical protein
MATTLKASKQGLAKVDIARRRKNWTKYSTAWCEAANFIGSSALRKFWRRQPIIHENFVSICKAVGVNWEEIVDFDEDRDNENNWIIEITALVEGESNRITDKISSLLQEIPANSLNIRLEKVNDGWESWNSPRYKYRYSDGENTIVKCKECQLAEDVIVETIVHLIPQLKELIEVKIAIFPSGNLVYLPKDLKVMIVDESEQLVPDLFGQSSENKDCLELEFKIQDEAMFGILLELNNIQLLEIVDLQDIVDLS